MLRNMLTPEHRTATQLELEFEKRVCQPVKRAIKMARCQIQQVQEAIDSISTQNGLVLQAPEILVVQMLDRGKVCVRMQLPVLLNRSRREAVCVKLRIC